MHQKQKSNFFKFKSIIIKILTFGCYNCDRKLTNNILEKEAKINIQKTKFDKIQLKISDIKSGLDKIEKVIREKRKLLTLLEQQITNIKEINSINSQNTEVSTNNSLTTQL